jgi:hypothetical protein
MAMVVSFGLLIATFLTLVVVPVLYFLLERTKEGLAAGSSGGRWRCIGCWRGRVEDALIPIALLTDCLLQYVMRYEWDESKRAANLAKHGVEFRKAEQFDWETAMEARDTRFEYGEERWIALGMIGSRLHVLIYTIRHGSIRLISLRRANICEREHYEKNKT